MGQLRELGCSCDWTRERFTMDTGLSRAVRQVFVHLHEKGWIYKGKYIINWCPRCKTALSDEEAEHKEESGHLWHIRYPLANSSNFIEIATTRPETMLGDTAVAVNPKDKRWAGLVGKTVILPLMNREIPVIHDDMVDMEFGTGALKITPAHDPADFEIGNRHQMDRIVVIAPDGRMNENAGKYYNMDRFECRKRVVQDLEKSGLLVKTADHVHAVGHCYRCDTVVEPYLSDQWFVKMKPLAQPGIRAAESGDIEFFPKSETKKYLDWMYNIRDWCISRQIWWGHQIPAWTCGDCGRITVALETPLVCEKCSGPKLEQDKDVLDTWFSSWLWPFSTMGWPDKTPDINAFYPTNVLATAPDIIFFWVARMIMAGYEFTGQKPFSHVYIHGVVRDDKGRKMSKSLGNSIDPLQVIQDYGADALRFTLVANTPQGKDVHLKKEKMPDGHESYPSFEVGRNFCNKLWNAARFVLQNLEDFKTAAQDIEALSLDISDHWILSRLAAVQAETESNFAKYRLNDVAQTLFHFVRDDFCDWYVEIKKHALYTNPSVENAYTARFLLLYVLSNILKMLHPIIPFITEEIWSVLILTARLEAVHDKEHLIEASSFQAQTDRWIRPEIDLQFSLLQEIVTSIRRMRKESSISPGKTLDVYIQTSDKSKQSLLLPVAALIRHLGKVNDLKMEEGLAKPELSKSEVVAGLEVILLLQGAIDVHEEISKKRLEIEKLNSQIAQIQKKFQNQDFQNRAPKEVVDKEKNKLKAFHENLEKLENALALLEKGCSKN